MSDLIASDFAWILRVPHAFLRRVLVLIVAARTRSLEGFRVKNSKGHNLDVSPKPPDAEWYTCLKCGPGRELEKSRVWSPQMHSILHAPRLRCFVQTFGSLERALDFDTFYSTREGLEEVWSSEKWAEGLEIIPSGDSEVKVLSTKRYPVPDTFDWYEIRTDREDEIQVEVGEKAGIESHFTLRRQRRFLLGDLEINWTIFRRFRKSPDGKKAVSLVRPPTSLQEELTKAGAKAGGVAGAGSLYKPDLDVHAPKSKSKNPRLQCAYCGRTPSVHPTPSCKTFNSLTDDQIAEKLMWGK